MRILEHLFIKGDQTVAYEDDDTSIVGRHTYDVASISAKDDDAAENPTYDDYGDMKKPNSFPMYDVDDDMNSTLISYRSVTSLNRSGSSFCRIWV